MVKSNRPKIIVLILTAATLAISCNKDQKTKILTGSEDDTNKPPIVENPTSPPDGPASPGGKKMVVKAEFGRLTNNGKSPSANYRLINITPGNPVKYGCETTIPSDASVPTYVYCLMEGAEYDLYHFGAKLIATVPEKSCHFLGKNGFYFFNKNPRDQNGQIIWNPKPEIKGPNYPVGGASEIGIPRGLDIDSYDTETSAELIAPAPDSVAEYDNRLIANYYVGFPFAKPPSAFFYSAPVNGKYYNYSDYSFSCVDSAEETLVHIVIAIREYDTLPDYLKGPFEMYGVGPYSRFGYNPYDYDKYDDIGSWYVPQEIGDPINLDSYPEFK
jgi:hypothetical protein